MQFYKNNFELFWNYIFPYNFTYRSLYKIYSYDYVLFLVNMLILITYLIY
jgi:hypothetical protein